MLIISGHRASGKTAALIGALMTDAAGVLVVGSIGMARYCLARWPALKGRVITAAKTEYIAGRDINLYVDEVELSDLPACARARVVARAS